MEPEVPPPKPLTVQELIPQQVADELSMMPPKERRRILYAAIKETLREMDDIDSGGKVWIPPDMILLIFSISLGSSVSINYLRRGPYPMAIPTDSSVMKGDPS